MIFALILFLTRPYFTVPIADFDKTDHTHVRTTGRVTLVKHEDDGDLHLRIVDGKSFITAEFIPSLPVEGSEKIRKGDTITVWGIRRHDDQHDWYECHPVERFEIIKK